MTTIIVGVDGSDAARRALEWAVAEARLRDARLTVVHSLEHRYSGEAWMLAQPDFTQVDEAALAVLDAGVDLASGQAPGLEVTGHLGYGSPAAVLLETAADAQMVVVGARGLGGLAGLWLGSVSRQVTHHSPVPVAVVPSEGSTSARTGPARVVVGVDGSPESVQALGFAVTEARVRAAHLRVVHTWTFPALAILPFTPDVPSPEELAADGEALIERCLADAGGADDVTIEPTVEAGSAAEALVAAAEDADLLVVGARGAGGFLGLRVGSVADACAGRSPVPVIIVPSEVP